MTTKTTDMKKIKYINIILLTLLLVGSCKQEPIVPEVAVAPDPGPAPLKGSADFTKFVAIGNSFVAGMQAGALFTEGQNNSLAAILNKQFQTVGAPATFNQPTIGASLGWNLFVTQPFLTNNTKPILGRMLLQGASPKPTPQAYAPGNLEALPNPAANPGFMYTGSKTALNNFSVSAITLGQALTPATGGPPPPAANPAFTPFYFRFASSPSPNGTSGSSIMSDAKAAGGTFYLFWLGLDDFFLYAAFGGDPTKAPLTPAGTFAARFNAALLTASPNTGLLTVDATSKAVIGNFPDIFVMPHFTAVAYNPIPLDAATATAVSTGFAGYNAALNGLVANAAAFGISAALATEIGTRKIAFSASSSNKILITDETLINLGPYFDGLKNAGAITQAQRDALSPYVMVRQTTSSDIIPLATGSVLGTVVGGNPLLVNGVSVPLGDQYVLIPSEITEIRAARDAFNSTIAGFAAVNSSRVALADVSTAMATLVTNKAGVMNSVTITPNINPPTGIFSEDGVHPNSRGYAFLSTVFISAINAKFGSTIPLTDISLYNATALPIP